MTNEETAQKVVNTINRAFKEDPAVINALQCVRFPCLDKWLADPDIICSKGIYSTIISPFDLLNMSLTLTTGYYIKPVWEKTKDENNVEINTMIGFRAELWEQAKGII